MESLGVDGVDVDLDFIVVRALREHRKTDPTSR